MMRGVRVSHTQKELALEGNLWNIQAYLSDTSISDKMLSLLIELLWGFVEMIDCSTFVVLNIQTFIN